MQRVEPAEVRANVDPYARGTGPANSPTPAEAAPASDADRGTEHGSADDHGTSEPYYPVSGSKTYWAAFGFSILWLGGLTAYGIGLVGVERLVTLTLEYNLLIGAAAWVPVVFAFFVAMLVNEAMTLRQQSSSLAIVASQLAEPEDLASRNLARLSRAIRREIEMFNTAVEAATNRMSTLETAANERLAFIERAAGAAQERVERATNKLGSEREKLAQFTQALDSVVLAASETLTTRLQDARAAARSASESLHAEHGAIAGLISTLQSASQSVSAKAIETGKEIERQAQRLDAASEAAAARSEQVVARHERQRSALADTIDRLKQENDHMARALDYQRDGMNKLVVAMAEENKKIGTFTVEGARRLDDAAALMAQRIVETTKLFAREAEKLRTSTELTTSGLEQAMQTIRSAGDNSFEAAGRLGSVLVGLRDTATTASQQIESTVGRLSKMLNELPAEAAAHANNLKLMLDHQSRAIQDLDSKVGAAYERVQASDYAPPPRQLEAPLHHTQLPPSQVPMQRALPPQPLHQPAQPIPLREPMQQRPVHQGPPQQMQYTQQSAQQSQRQNPVVPPYQHAPLEHQSQQQPKSFATQPNREPQQPSRPLPSFRGDPIADQAATNFNIPPGEQMPMAGYAQNRGPSPHPERATEASESRGWFGLAKRFVKPQNEEPELSLDDRSSWDMKSLLAAAETKDGDRRSGAQPTQSARRLDPRDMQAHDRMPMQDPRTAQHPQQQRAQRGGSLPAELQPVHTSSRHMIETLQAMAIDLSRFLEDDPPADLLRRYRNGERNVFARRLASILGADHVRIIARKYHEDREFRETVDRYIHQFEALLEQTARSDRENVLVETYLTSQTGKVYVTLASAIGRLS